MTKYLSKRLLKVKGYSEEIANKIDMETKRIIDESYEKVKQILSEKRDTLEILARSLLKNEKVEADEFERIYNGENPFEVEALIA